MFTFITSPLGGLLLKLGAVLAIAALAWWAWGRFTGHYEAVGAARVQLAWDQDKAVRNKAIADQALMWNAQREKTEVAERERDEARSKLFASIPTLPPDVAHQRVPAAFVGVLRDNARAANSAGATAVTDQAAAPTTASADAAANESDLGLIAGWIGEVAKIHAECRDRVTAWVEFYAGLRAAQPKEQPQ